MCMKMRGANKPSADMVATAFRGRFERDRALRSEALELLRGGSG
jgi:GTP cyclohydrolase I